MTDIILLHKIEHSYTDDFEVEELTEADVEHIEEQIKSGNVAGQLCTTDPENPDEVHYGWWSISPTPNL